jgi:hypothetical protein
MKYILTIIFLLIGCKHEPVRNPEPIQEQSGLSDWEAMPQSKQWNDIVLNALDLYGQGMLTTKSVKDGKQFCANFDSLTRDDRKAFYLMMISAMARYESSFKTESQYKESFKDENGENIISRGLLQISKGSSRYYDCGITDAQMLHDPKMNLECGVRILNKWIVKDECLACRENEKWLGGARYWAVLRNTRESFNKIKNKTKSINICKGLTNDQADIGAGKAP